MRSSQTIPALPLIWALCAAVSVPLGCSSDDSGGDEADEAGEAGDAGSAEAAGEEGEGEGEADGEGGDVAGTQGGDDGGFPCQIYRKPDCQPQNAPPIVPYRPGQGCRDDEQCIDETPDTTCDRSANQCRDPEGCLLDWICHECPHNPDIRCHGALTPLADKFGCISAESECGCRFTEAPHCPDGQFPHQVCAEDGTRCFTGGCKEAECPCIPDPECAANEVAEVNDEGCLTGRCTQPDCPPVAEPICQCGNRTAVSRVGCILGQCELEPLPCDPLEVPSCPRDQIPGLSSIGQACLTGECVVGLCVDACDDDRDCATSDACLPYDGGCDVCQPRRCDVDLDCPPRTDCVTGRCRLRQVPDANCDGEDSCDGGLECDDAGCGKCATPCQCREHEDCPAGFRCDDCSCEQGCRSDRECAADLKCDPVSGECLECSCNANGDCADGEYCGCFCLDGCRDSEECPPWRVCSLETHQCVPEIQCNRDDDCGGGSLCVDQTCVRDLGVCEGGAEQCSAQWDWRVQGWFCRKDTNPVPPCPEDRGQDCFAPDDEVPSACLCELDECLDAPCDGENHEVCPAGAYHCSKADPGNPQIEGVCREGRPEERRLCRQDDDCIPETCEVPTFCVHFDFPECTTRITPGSEEDRDAIVACTCEDSACRTHYE